MNRRQFTKLALMGAFGGLASAGCREEDVGGPVEVTYWEKWTDFEGEAMRAVVEAFNEERDDIQVKLLTISQIDQKTLMATAGGIPPDVAGLWSQNLVSYADKNALLPLDDYLSAAGLGREDFIPCYWDMLEHRGHIWGLPTTPASVALHWNKRLFDEAGLPADEPPQTMEQLWEYTQLLTKRDEHGKIVQMGFMPAEPGWWNWAWGYFFGGRLWDGEGTITCDSAENVRAFEWVQSYAKQYGTKELQVFRSGFGNFSSAQNAFLDGRVAMELQGVWMHNFIDMYAKHLDWGAAPFPHPADRPDLANTTIVEEDVVAIPNGAKHPDEAFEFMQFVNSQRGMELLCMGQRKHTPLREVSQEFLDQHPNPYISVFIELARSANALTTPKLSIWNEYANEMSAAFDEVWLDRKSGEEALRYVQNRMQPKLERVLRRWERLGWRSA
ncbi:MAG: ABC transporter substrate-binding protein [Armatimonadota bacterium]